MVTTLYGQIQVMESRSNAAGLGHRLPINLRTVAPYHAASVDYGLPSTLLSREKMVPVCQRMFGHERVSQASRPSYLLKGPCPIMLDLLILDDVFA